MPAMYRALLGATALSVALHSPAIADEIIVKITDLVFSPSSVTAKVGDTIKWVNDDFIDHTVTADDGSFDLPISVGQTASVEVKTPGVVPYYCRVHPNMKGTFEAD